MNTDTETTTPADIAILRSALNNALAGLRMAELQNAQLGGNYNVNTAVEVTLMSLGSELADELHEHHDEVSYDVDDVQRWIGNGVGNWEERNA